MRILHLATDAFGGHGGIAQYNRDLLTALCSAPGVEEVVSIPRLVPNRLEPLPDRLRYLTSAAGTKGRYVRAFARQVAMMRADLVVCAHINLLPLAFVARLRCRAPLALFIYGIDAWNPPARVMSRLPAKHVDQVVSISTTTLDRFLEWSKVRRGLCTVLPNAFDAGAFGAGEKSRVLLERHALTGKTVIMTFGRMAGGERYKGFDEVLELLPRLARERPDIVYLLAGDGDDRGRLEQKATTLGIRDRVVFTGRIEEREKADYYRLADAFVMPSHGEGFGFVFLEAMACGTPVVASKVDGGREAVRNGMLGEIVDPGDQDDLLRGTLSALAKVRGVIPQGLDHFSFANFEKRTHEWLAPLDLNRHQSIADRSKRVCDNSERNVV